MGATTVEAVKLMSPRPVAPSPIAILEFVQLKLGFPVPIKSTFTCAPEHTVWFGGSVTVEQNGTPVPLADFKNDRADGKLVMSAIVGRDGLVNGPATLSVDATRKTFYGLRTVSSNSRISGLPLTITTFCASAETVAAC